MKYLYDIYRNCEMLWLSTSVECKTVCANLTKLICEGTHENTNASLTDTQKTLSFDSLQLKHPHNKHNTPT